MSKLSRELAAALRVRRTSVGSWASSTAAQTSMRSNRRRDTNPELAVRRLLHRAGLRYRVDHAPRGVRPLRRADIVFTRLRVAVFVDGCFWHGCPDHFVAPRTHADYWSPKIARNRERDLAAAENLERNGWVALRFWEHEAPEAVAAAIEACVTQRRQDSA